MKKNIRTTEYAQAGTSAVQTGEHCPETGWWRSLQSEDSDPSAHARFLGEGSVMPAVGDAPGFWVPSKNARLQTDY